MEYDLSQATSLVKQIKYLKSSLDTGNLGGIEKDLLYNIFNGKYFNDMVIQLTSLKLEGNVNLKNVNFKHKSILRDFEKIYYNFKIAPKTKSNVPQYEICIDDDDGSVIYTHNIRGTKSENKQEDLINILKYNTMTYSLDNIRKIEYKGLKITALCVLFTPACIEILKDINEWYHNVIKITLTSLDMLMFDNSDLGISEAFEGDTTKLFSNLANGSVVLVPDRNRGDSFKVVPRNFNLDLNSGIHDRDIDHIDNMLCKRTLVKKLDLLKYFPKNIHADDLINSYAFEDKYIMQKVIKSKDSYCLNNFAEILSTIFELEDDIRVLGTSDYLNIAETSEDYNDVLNSVLNLGMYVEVESDNYYISSRRRITETRMSFVFNTLITTLLQRIVLNKELALFPAFIVANKFNMYLNSVTNTGFYTEYWWHSIKYLEEDKLNQIQNFINCLSIFFSIDKSSNFGNIVNPSDILEGDCKVYINELESLVSAIFNEKLIPIEKDSVLIDVKYISKLLDFIHNFDISSNLSLPSRYKKFNTLTDTLIDFGKIDLSSEEYCVLNISVCKLQIDTEEDKESFAYTLISMISSLVSDVIEISKGNFNTSVSIRGITGDNVPYSSNILNEFKEQSKINVYYKGVFNVSGIVEFFESIISLSNKDITLHRDDLYPIYDILGIENIK